MLLLGYRITHGNHLRKAFITGTTLLLNSTSTDVLWPVSIPDNMHRITRKSVAQIDIRLRIKMLCQSMGEAVVIGGDVFCTKYSFRIGETEKLESLKCSESWLSTYCDEHISTFEHLHQFG